MTVKIRLARHGRKKAPYYRLVVADSRCPRDGRFIEAVGIYQPLVKSPDQQVRVDEAKVLTWLGHGAIPSDTVRSILRKQGIMQKFHEARQALKGTGTRSNAPAKSVQPAPAAPAEAPVETPVEAPAQDIVAPVELVEEAAAPTPEQPKTDKE